MIQKEGNTEILQSLNTTIFNKQGKEEKVILKQEKIPQTINIEESLSLFEHEKRLIQNHF